MHRGVFSTTVLNCGKHHTFNDLCVYADERYVTMNIHGLLHLPEVVRNLGPLWAHSCFPFESANGDLLKLFHGSSGVEKQVMLSCSQLVKVAV